MVKVATFTGIYFKNGSALKATEIKSILCWPCCWLQCSRNRWLCDDRRAFYEIKRKCSSLNIYISVKIRGERARHCTMRSRITACGLGSRPTRRFQLYQLLQTVQSRRRGLMWLTSNEQRRCTWYAQIRAGTSQTTSVRGALRMCNLCVRGEAEPTQLANVLH